MCGITGLFSISGKFQINAHAYVDLMNTQLKHRGPDDSGVWENDANTVCLGHRRLNIIDLSQNSHQPMVGSDGSAIAFNGEIYNYKEIRADLEQCEFRSEGDTEVVLNLYRKKGISFLNDLVGMFAIALWDANTNKLILARDRIGKKPLYYTRQNGILAFASEPQALLQLPWIEKAIDDEALYHFITFGFVPPPATMFRDIQKLGVGECLEIDAHGATSHKTYWAVSLQETHNSEDSLKRELMTKLNKSVDYRMVSDVPLGVFLSGGVDSTALATLMREKTDGVIKSFSISFAGQPEYDEAQLARETAKRLNLDHHEKVVTQDDMRKMIKTIASILDEPLADPTCIPLYFLSELAHEQDIKVVFSGDGPDELLFGYRNWRQYRNAYPWFRIFSQLPQFVRTLVYKTSIALSLSARVTEIFYRASKGFELFWGSAGSFKESEKLSLLSEEFRSKAKNWNSHNIINRLRKEYDDLSGSNKSDANWMCYLGLKFVVPNFFLHRADRMGMRHSVEIRTPYLDHDFVNYALSIRDTWKVQNGVPKAIFKEALKGKIPEEILAGSKKGFCVPLREWGQDIMIAGIENGLKIVNEKTNLFDESAVLAQVDKFKAGDKSLTNNVWMVYFLIAWIQVWIVE